MPAEVVLAKSVADTSAALTAYTTPDSFTIAEKEGIKNCVLRRVDTSVAHTATDKGYVRINKKSTGTIRNPLLIPFANTVGFAKGEDVVSMGKGYYDGLDLKLKENDELEVYGQFEVASKDQGALMHLVYGGVQPPEMFADLPCHWVRHVTTAPVVDTWSPAAEINDTDGLDPQKKYALVGVKVEPGDTQGAIGFRCYPKNDQTWKRGFSIVEGYYPMLDCPVFPGNVPFVIEQYNGIATVVSNLFLHFKEIG